jgi:two-component system sensor histidine kinase UhpB
MYKNKNALNILIVEDNPGDFALISDYLEEHISNPTIEHARNFTEADAKLSVQQAGFDVILLDLTLPDKTGEDLIRDTVEKSKGAPVIVLTGYADIEFSIRSLSLKASDYLLKDDINASSLYKSIVYNIERKKSNQLLEESEKRYSNLFQMSPQPMWIFDMENYKFFQVNKAAIANYGYSEEEFLQMTLFDIVPKVDVESVKKIDSNLEAVNVNLHKGRFKHIKKSGEIIDVDIYSNLITISDKIYQFVISIDITEKVLYEHKITKAIIKAQEDERYEIGAELHDNICQILATGQLSLELLSDHVPESSHKWLHKTKEHINLALNEIRKISHRLAPAFFEEATLEHAIAKLLSNFNQKKQFTIHFNFDESISELHLKTELQLNLYRIVQEQLNNILKYAKATTVNVGLSTAKGHIILSISDNGVGFDTSTTEKGIGLSNMKRRSELFSGEFDIQSSPGNGCELTISIPMQHAEIE